MQFDRETVEEGVGTMAVLLNRVVWLDPDRFDVQHRMWLRMVNRLGLDGKLTVDDITDAITALIRKHPPHEVTPPMFLEHAARAAAARYAEVTRMEQAARATPGVLMYEAINRHFDHLASERPDADDWLRAEHRRQVTLVLDSGIPDELIAPLLASMQQLVDEAILWGTSRRTALGGPVA